MSGASISINNNQFIGNKAVKNGGALHLDWDSLWISNTEFISNAAVNGGALYYINLGNDFAGVELMKILDEQNNEEFGGMRNVSFVQNSASNVGGAMKIFFKYSQLQTEAVIFENNFDRNQQTVNQGRPSYYLLSFYDRRIMDQVGRLDDNLEDLLKNPKFTVRKKCFLDSQNSE